ncbi:GNAT family N-acetyltransferase [Sphingosinicella sp. CPCC 101087]|uniref:GNAT family N-acetyltransferase n=1 Tax=Sphingosinicella sp. CPCC 101087 TaxID=2497754 RepID=UPI00101D641C|nr:GNAT family N-acetyltransferase [Sphingosinicella sp. CPCC 101087]
MTVQWRKAGPEDAAIMAAIGRETFVETFGNLYTPEDLAAFLVNHSEEKWRADLADPEYSIRLGESDGRAAAYAKIGPPSLPLEAKGPTIELRQFYIRKPWQGAGLAPPLMEWVLAEARARGAVAVQLSVFTENVRARRFYERYGFEYAGENKFMVGNQADDDLIMRLNL